MCLVPLDSLIDRHARVFFFCVCKFLLSLGPLDSLIDRHARGDNLANNKKRTQFFRCQYLYFGTSKASQVTKGTSKASQVSHFTLLALLVPKYLACEAEAERVV